MVDYGKAFETKFKEDWLRTMPNASIDRLYDTMNGFKYISNISDFIGYSYPNIFYLECKAHKGASLPIDAVSQYEKLTSKVGIKGVRAGVVCWLYEKDKILYIPISTMTQILNDGDRSFGIRHLGKYNIIEIPSVKKRVFFDSDYSVLLNLKEGD